MQYLAIIGDIKQSRQQSERGQLQEQLNRVLSSLNQRYALHFASPFTVTLGDEFQALCYQTIPLFQLLDELQLALPEIQIRFGIGCGAIYTAIDAKQSIGADGPAYWRARQAIQMVYQTNHYETVNLCVLTGNQTLDQQLNPVLALCEFVKYNWVQSQRETFRLVVEAGIYQADFNQQELAKSVGLSPSALAKRLKSTGLKLYFQNKALLYQQLIQEMTEQEEGSTHELA